MASGMEMMVGTILKGLGFDRDQVEAKAQEIYNDANARFHAIEAQLARIEDKLDLICKHIPQTEEEKKDVDHGLVQEG